MSVAELATAIISVQTLAGLQSVLDRSNYRVGTLAFVNATGGWFMLVGSSSLTADGVNVIASSDSRRGDASVWVSVPLLSAGGQADDLSAAGTLVSLSVTETVLGANTWAATRGGVGTAITTDGTTQVTILTCLCPANSGNDWNVSLMGIDVTGAPPISGDFYRGDLQFSTMRVGSAAPTISPSSPSAANVQSSGGGSAYAIQAAVSGNSVVVQVKGATGKTVHWSRAGQGMAVS